MNDWVFSSTIVALSSLHYFHQEIYASSLFNIGGRMSTKMASQFDQLMVWNTMSSNVALQMGGNVPALL